SSATEADFIKKKIAYFHERRNFIDYQFVDKPYLRKGSNSLGIIVDRTNLADVKYEFCSLPNSRFVSIYYFSVQKPIDLSNKSIQDFWCLELNRLLTGIKEDYLLITNGRFQFHDTSIFTISGAVEMANMSSQPVVPLPGWFKDSSRIAPSLLALSGKP